MTNLRNWKIRTKLTLMVVAFVIVLSTYAAISYNTRQQLQIDGPYYGRIVRTRRMLTDIAPSPLNLNEVELVVQELASTTDSEQRAALIHKFRSLHQTYQTAYAQWQKMLENYPNDALKHVLLVRAYEPAVRFFDVTEGELIPAVLAGDRTRAASLVNGTLRQDYTEHRQGIDEAMQLADAENTRVKQEAAALISSRDMLQKGLLIGSIVGFGLVLGPLISRSITHPLRQTVNALAATSVQLATTIEEHERTAMNQSAAVNQTTSAMDELDASFHQTTEVVKSAAERVQHAVTVANEGIKTVRQMQEGMIDLKETVGTTVAGQMLTLSEQIAQISNITNQVSDLASQTNMLALNAAVEAARAGEHGRGFAVVAAEIRKLADASRKSAERINALLNDIQRATNAAVMATEESTKTVEKAIQRAQATVATFNELKDSSNSAADAAQQTLLSVPQQVTAVKQVLESMDALNIGSRETASAIGQSRIGSETLREAVAQLKSTI
jgi:methyl-accepting chemotaxis protein